MRLDATHVGLGQKGKAKRGPRKDASVPLDLCCESPVSPKRNVDPILSHISAEEPMAKSRSRATAEECKSKALYKVWYEFQPSEKAARVRFAAWNELLSEFSVDFHRMWEDIVSKELHARAALATWRRQPCKRIGKVLPSGFASWSAFLANGGIQDPSTGAGSLSPYDISHFWNDQCSCSPSCWCFQAPSCAPAPTDDEPPIKRKRVPCACAAEPCVCSTVVSKTKEEELENLRTMRKLLPFGTKALDARIAELESSKASVPVVKLGDVLRAEQALEDERNLLRLKAAEQDELARKCFAFWWTLEQQFATEHKRAPASSLEMLKWFWQGREAFVQAFRKRVGKEALNYL